MTSKERGFKTPPPYLSNQVNNINNLNTMNMNKTNSSFINGIGKNGEQLISLFDINAVLDEVT